jgi:nitroimidazol reductase NimA-like FMN-containing flavoprotein (pyridoxamine 5'-phosphate oxidase superfamily)
MDIPELAARAGIDPGYLTYFESAPDGNLSGGTLLLIAMALDTTPFELAGGTTDRPLGHGEPVARGELRELSPDQCRTHLEAGGVGRVVYDSARGPIAIPVNYEFTEGQVVFSTDAGKAAALGETQDPVSFEIDQIDEGLSEGWSVLATGTCRRITDPGEIERLSSLDLESWADGDRHALVAIVPVETTGRVIVHHITDADED